MFNTGGRQWQVGAVYLNGNLLNVRIYGNPANVASVPDLPATLDLKLKNTTFRGRDASRANITRAEAGGNNAYVQFIWTISSTFFAAGDMISGQVQLPGTDTARLLPTGGVNGQVLKIALGVPTWGTDQGGAGGGDDIVQKFTDTGRPNLLTPSSELYIDINTVDLSAAQQELRDTGSYKISHHLKLDISVATSGNFRMEIWPRTGGTQAVTTSTYTALPTTFSSQMIRLDVPAVASTATGYRVRLAFDQVVGLITSNNVESTSYVIAVSYTHLTLPTKRIV